jgi:hypothetical protein
MKPTPRSKPQQTQSERERNRQKAIDGADAARAKDLAEPTQAQLDDWWPKPEVWDQPRTRSVHSKDERDYRGSRANEDKAAIVRRELRLVMRSNEQLSMSEIARRTRGKMDLPPGIPLPSERTLRRLIAQILSER